MRDEEEEASFLYTVPRPKGPDEGPEGDSNGHIASGAQRASQSSFIHICLLQRVEAPQLDRGHTCRTPLALRTAPWTSLPWENDASSCDWSEQRLPPTT